MLKVAETDYNIITLMEEKRRYTRALWAALSGISPRSTTTSEMHGTWLAIKTKSVACLDYVD